MTRHNGHSRRSFSYTERESIERGDCPSPFADAVAHMFIHMQISAHTVAGFYRISVRDVAMLVKWVATANLKRIMNRQPPWEKP